MCWNSVFPLSPLSAVSTWSSHTRVRAHTHPCTSAHRGGGTGEGSVRRRGPACLLCSPSARCLARSAGRFAGADSRPGRGPSCGLSPHGSARGVVRSPQLEDTLGRDETVAGRPGRARMAWLLAGVARSEPLEGVTVRQKRGASVSARGAAGRGAGGGRSGGAAAPLGPRRPPSSPPHSRAWRAAPARRPEGPLASVTQQLGGVGKMARLCCASVSTPAQQPQERHTRFVGLSRGSILVRMLPAVKRPQ